MEHLRLKGICFKQMWLKIRSGIACFSILWQCNGVLIKLMESEGS
jgi:hypothetical protein